MTLKRSANANWFSHDREAFFWKTETGFDKSFTNVFPSYLICIPCYWMSSHIEDPIEDIVLKRSYHSLVQPFSSVQLSRSVVSDSLWPHESQHARPPCPSPTPGVYPNSYPSSRWCHPAISSSAVPFSSCPQSLPASESFPMSQHFTWGGQSTGVSALASFLPKNNRDWSPLEWTG